MSAPSLVTVPALLEEALAETNALHLPGARERHRGQLARVVERARLVLELEAEGSADADTIAGARRALIEALAARARDACHGAGQLSRGSQRAPTREACAEGWQRVEAIVVVAEESAREAAHTALALGDEGDAIGAAVRSAEVAAREARRIVEERNHAYTFHADPGVSFGEGWYVAAAAVLAGVAIQIEPDKPQTRQVERFLGDAGLSGLLVPYRSRPRANKHLPAIVAQAFRADPVAAQRALRAAFLGEAPIPPAVIDWSERILAGAPATPKVLLWVRHAVHHPMRNTLRSELIELAQRALDAGLVPILFGDAVRDGEPPPGAVDMTLGWKEPPFQGADMRRAQLQLFEHLRCAHAVVGQLGVTTAGMDGPALMGLPTLYLTDVTNVRLSAWVGAVPGYEEVVRDAGYLERIGDTLTRWAEARPP
jgi:hypothetical protein